MIQCALLVDAETGDRLYLLFEDGRFNVPLAILDDDHVEQLTYLYESNRSPAPEPAAFEADPDEQAEIEAARTLAICPDCRRPYGEGISHRQCIPF